MAVRNTLICAVVAAILPPAARETVIGDLLERHASPLRFLAEGVKAMPYVVASQLRRHSSFVVLCLQAFALFACLGGFVPDAAGAVVPMWARAGIPALAAVLGLVLRDVYRGERRPLLNAILDAAVAGLLASAAEWTLIALSHAHAIEAHWVLPPKLAFLAGLSLPILVVLRMGSGLDTPSPLTGIGRLTADDLVRDYARFARGVRWRNLAEIAACVLTIAGSAFVLLRLKPAVAPIGWTMLAVWVAVAAYLALRGWARQMPDGFAPLRDQYRGELTRQHNLRRVMWWWWFVPLFLGLGTNLIAPGILSGNPLRLGAGVAAFAALAFCIAKLVSDRGKQVREEVSTLDSLAEA